MFIIMLFFSFICLISNGLQTIDSYSDDACFNVIVESNINRIDCKGSGCEKMWIGGAHYVSNKNAPKWKKSLIRSSNSSINTSKNENEYNLVVDGTFHKKTSILIECRENHRCKINNGFEIELSNLKCDGQCIIENGILPKIIRFPLNENCGSWIHESFIFALPFCLIQTIVAFYWLYLHKIIDYCYILFFISGQAHKNFKIPVFYDYSLEKVLQFQFDESKRKTKFHKNQHTIVDSPLKNYNDKIAYELVNQQILIGYDALVKKYSQNCNDSNVDNILKYSLPNYISQIIIEYCGNENEISFFYAKHCLYPKYKSKYIQFVKYFTIYQMIVCVLLIMSVAILFNEYFIWYSSVKNSIKNGSRINSKNQNIIAIESRDWHFYQSLAAMFATNFLFHKTFVVLSSFVFLWSGSSAKLFEKEIEEKINSNANDDETLMLKLSKEKESNGTQPTSIRSIKVLFRHILGIRVKFGDDISSQLKLFHVGRWVSRYEISLQVYVTVLVCILVPVFLIAGFFACLMPLLLSILLVGSLIMLQKMLNNPKWQVSNVLDNIYIDIMDCYKYKTFTKDKLKSTFYILSIVMILFGIQILFYAIYRLSIFGSISLYRGNSWVSVFAGDRTDWGNVYCKNDSWILFPKRVNFGTFVLWLARWIT